MRVKMWLENFIFRSEEERLCQKYTRLMNRAYKIALIDKERSDRINLRAQKILEHLRRINYKEVDTSF